MSKARDLVPEVFDDPLFVSEDLSAPAVLWDLLRLLKAPGVDRSADFVGRAFAFASWCLAQDDAAPSNPAAIGFFAKAAGPGGVSVDTLAAHLSREESLELDGLFRHHYGDATAAEIKRKVVARERR